MRKILILLALCACTVFADWSYVVETGYETMQCGGKIQHVTYYPTYCTPAEDGSDQSEYWECDAKSGANQWLCDSKDCSKACSITQRQNRLSECEQGFIYSCANEIANNFTSPGMQLFLIHVNGAEFYGVSQYVDRNCKGTHMYHKAFYRSNVCMGYIEQTYEKTFCNSDGFVEYMAKCDSECNGCAQQPYVYHGCLDDNSGNYFYCLSNNSSWN